MPLPYKTTLGTLGSPWPGLLQDGFIIYLPCLISHLHPRTGGLKVYPYLEGSTMLWAGYVPDFSYAVDKPGPDMAGPSGHGH